LKLFFQTPKNIDLNQVSATIRKFRESKKWSRSEIARQLEISSQLYGQYEDDKRSPGGDFFIRWKQKFGQDLTEAIVSHGTHEVTETDTEMDHESRRSLEKTLENLSEDKIRSTAIIERLVTMLERQFSSGALPKTHQEDFGPEHNKVSPGFGSVVPSGKGAKEKPGSKH
jgi:transcriptional regulator with XRE-family HTH domain